MLIRLTIFLIIYNVFEGVAQAPIGGSSSFGFLTVPASARIAGVGGDNVSIREWDPNMLFSNPALINSEMINHVSTTYIPYFAGIKYTTLSGVFNVPGLGLAGAGIQYMSYGNFTETDPSGNIIGTFSANEYAVTASHSRTIENYSIGVSAKLIGSQLGTYSSYAVAMDMGASFNHPNKRFSFAITVRNIGYAFKNYTPGTTPSLPFDALAGMTYKPAHMPLRFSVTLHNLNVYNISYNDPTLNITYDANGNPIQQTSSVPDILARHLIIGGEFLLSKNFNIRVGYNHMRRMELKLDNFTWLEGFSLGAMIRVKKFEFAYTRAWYNAAGSNSFLTISTNLQNFKKKSKPAEGS